MPQSKTLFEIYKSAHLAALDAANSTTPKTVIMQAVQSGPIKEFTNDGQDPRDWETWASIFIQRFVDMRNKAGMPSPSAQQDLKNAKPVSTPSPSPAKPIESVSEQAGVQSS